MDNAQKAIMIGVGLFITIIIISAVLLIVNLGTGLVDDATSELSTMSSSLQNQILQSYDNKDLSGVQVRSAVQQYLRATDMVVVLIGSEGIVATVGNVDGITSIMPDDTANPENTESFTVAPNIYNSTEENGVHETTITAFNRVENAGNQYIDSASRYTSYVLRIEGTETIVGIVIIPMGTNIASTGFSVPDRG